MHGRKDGVKDMLWILRVADLEKGVNQCTLSIGLKCNVEVENTPGGCVA